MIHKFRLIRNGKIVGYEQHILRPQCGDDNLNVICVCYSTPKQLENPRHYPRCSCFDKADFIFHDHKDMFTGLHDSEGREIYEGDIDSKGFVFTYDVDMGGWYRMKNGEGFQWHAQALRQGRLPFKVIGNIHEEAPHDPS